MDDTTSRVYDLTFPSPVTLKEISAIALVAELWREEIAHRTEIKTVKNRKIPILDLAWNIPLEKMMPLVPSKLYDLLDEYHHKFELSIVLWLQHHFINVVFDSDYYDGYIGSLNNFHDFVWDQNGTIHYVRTAKRMMLSDRLPAFEKFRIAYMYCLEDDIRRIWPSVRWRMTGINFQDTPLLYYWICRIINELHSIPNPRDVPIDEFMLSNCSGGGFYSVEYFWNRTPYERRSQATIAMSSFDPGLFARFILPRLNDFELRSLLAERGAAFMTSLMENVGKNYANALPAWMYIRNQMNVSQFIQLIQILLSHETNYFIIEERSNSKAKVNLCCEIWKSSPENLKLSALKNNRIFSNKDVFRRIKAEPSEPREMRFLITILLDANFEQRHKFWCENWRNLIFGAPVEDLQVVMKLCFQDENDVSSFKEQHMSKYENIRLFCVQSLEHGCFEELSKFLYFCYSDKQNVKVLKQQLLRSNFLAKKSILSFSILFDYTRELNAFVEDAFEDFDLRLEFKNQFLSSPVNEDVLFECVRDGYFDCLIQFVETFVPEERAVDVKQRLLDYFKERLVSGSICQVEGGKLQKFLVWLLGSEDEIGKFKQSLSISDVFCKMIQVTLKRGKHSSDGSMKYPDKLDDFLNWYFDNNAEEIRKIKEQYSDRLKVFGD